MSTSPAADGQKEPLDRLPAVSRGLLRYECVEVQGGALGTRGAIPNLAGLPADSVGPLGTQSGIRHSDIEKLDWYT